MSQPSLLEGLDDELDASKRGGRQGHGGGGSGRAWKGAKIAFAAFVLLIAVGVLAAQFGGGPSVREEMLIRPVICSETGEVFERFKYPKGHRTPFENPKTGRKTLYPAELCYWTKDGKAKLEPTYVLIGLYMGKEEPNTCPDCGRRVVGHNPPPPAELMNEALARKRAEHGG